MATSIKLATELISLPTPSIIQLPSSVRILAPNSFAALNAACASADSSGFLSIDCPLAMEAMATARMVCDLEAGIRILPLSFECITLNFKSDLITERKNSGNRAFYKIFWQVDQNQGQDYILTFYLLPTSSRYAEILAAWSLSSRFRRWNISVTLSLASVSMKCW